jgi:hypothetical protein
MGESLPTCVRMNTATQMNLTKIRHIRRISRARRILRARSLTQLLTYKGLEIRVGTALLGLSPPKATGILSAQLGTLHAIRKMEVLSSTTPVNATFHYVFVLWRGYLIFHAKGPALANTKTRTE